MAIIKKVFDKEFYKRIEGEDKYNKNQDWVDNLDGKAINTKKINVNKRDIYIKNAWLKYVYDTLFIKEKETNTVNDILCRILTYSERYVEQYGIMPRFVKLSKRDLSMIENYNSSVIKNNKILDMEILVEE